MDDAKKLSKKLYQEKHYQEHKDEYIARSKARRIEFQNFVNALKENKPCMDCGNIFPPVCMDFDHRDPTDKVDNIARLVVRGNKAKLLEEIEKCDLVCANCHRKRTFL